MSDVHIPEFDNVDLNASPFQATNDDLETQDDGLQDWGKVTLAGQTLPVVGPVNESNLAILQPKISLGETNKDSDQLLSVWIQSDWTGGGQVEDLQEQSDGQRFYYSTCETRFPQQLTLPLETTKFNLAGVMDQAYPIGDYGDIDNERFYAAFGTHLCTWDPGTQTFTQVATLSAAPVHKGIVFDDELWIPQGVTGFDIWNGVSLTHSASLAAHSSPAVPITVHPISFEEWDDRIVVLTAEGAMGIWDGVSWEFDDSCKLRGNRKPRSVVLWWDINREPTIYLVTNRDVWAFDPTIPRLYRTGLQFPRHPDQGKGATMWRDDSMYVSVGVGVHQLALGGVISAMGLDRNDGLPSYVRGYIVDMEPEYNSMYALIQGLATASVTDDPAMLGPNLEETLVYGDSMVIQSGSASARSTLQCWTGLGWHTAWESDNSGGLPSRVMVSDSQDDYAIWWGYGNQMHHQQLRRTFHNPKQGMELGIDRFALSASHRTGEFDADMAMFWKLASHLEVQLDKSSRQQLDIYYLTDADPDSWVHLGQVSGTGTKLLMFGVDGNGFSKGLKFRWIEFRYDFVSSTALETPVVRWISLKFLKLPLQTKSFSFTVPLITNELWDGLGPQEIRDFLDGLAIRGEFYPFKSLDRMYRVRLSQTQGPQLTGQDDRGSRQVNLIELDPTHEAIVSGA